MTVTPSPTDASVPPPLMLEIVEIPVEATQLAAHNPLRVFTHRFTGFALLEVVKAFVLQDLYVAVDRGLHAKGGHALVDLFLQVGNQTAALGASLGCLFSHRTRARSSSRRARCPASGSASRSGLPSVLQQLVSSVLR